MCDIHINIHQRYISSDLFTKVSGSLAELYLKPFLCDIAPVRLENMKSNACFATEATFWACVCVCESD